MWSDGTHRCEVSRYQSEEMKISNILFHLVKIEPTTVAYTRTIFFIFTSYFSYHITFLHGICQSNEKKYFSSWGLTNKQYHPPSLIMFIMNNNIINIKNIEHWPVQQKDVS